MRKIAELSVFLRPSIDLPNSLNLKTDEFHEGWSFVRNGNAHRLEKKITKSGWQFIRIAASPLKSGVGSTPQDAIAAALKLVLRRVSHYFNAIEVKSIELTKYPWFFLARVNVAPYRIQQDSSSSVKNVAIFNEPRSRRRPTQYSEEMRPELESAMPMLREMMASSAGLDA